MEDFINVETLYGVGCIRKSSIVAVSEGIDPNWRDNVLKTGLYTPKDLKTKTFSSLNVEGHPDKITATESAKSILDKLGESFSGYIPQNSNLFARFLISMSSDVSCYIRKTAISCVLPTKDPSNCLIYIIGAQDPIMIFESVEAVLNDIK